MVKRWIEAILQNVVAAALITLIPGALATYLTAIGTRWVTPLMLGLAAAAVSDLTLFVLRRQIGLPVKRLVPDENNIETFGRGLFQRRAGSSRLGCFRVERISRR